MRTPRKATPGTKKVLIVSHTLPPVGGAGVQRCAKFIKYLGNFGWETMALTVKNPSVPLFDKSQTFDIPADCKIFRARTFEPGYHLKQDIFHGKKEGRLKGSVLNLLRFMKKNLLIPDPQISWWPGLIVKLVQVIKREAPNCIFVSAPPFSTLMAVTFVGKLLGVPVIVDFRDDWAFYRLHMENAVKTSFATNLDRLFERYVVSNCSAITAATGSYLDNILNRNPSARQVQATTITNGFDEEDFFPFRYNGCSGETQNPRIEFLYSGTVWKATSLVPLAKALRILVSENQHLIDEIRIRVYGRVVPDELHCLKDPQLAHLIELMDYVPHDEIINAMFKANVLIVSLSDLEGARNIIPAKTFEYMATGKHILAIVPEGETSRLLRNTYPNSSIIHPDNSESIAENISKFIRKRELLSLKADIDLLKYERKRLAQKLSAVLMSVIQQSTN